MTGIFVKNSGLITVEQIEKRTEYYYKSSKAKETYRQVMSSNLALLLVHRSVVHEREAVAMSDNISHVIFGSLRVDDTLFIHQVMNCLAVVENDHCSRAEL